MTMIIPSMSYNIIYFDPTNTSVVNNNYRLIELANELIPPKTTVEVSYLCLESRTIDNFLQIQSITVKLFDCEISLATDGYYKLVYSYKHDVILAEWIL